MYLIIFSLAIIIRGLNWVKRLPRKLEIFILKKFRKELNQILVKPGGLEFSSSISEGFKNNKRMDKLSMIGKVIYSIWKTYNKNIRG